MKPKSIGSAILQGKCPQCREGNIFPNSIISFKNLTAVNHHCPHCQAVLTPEPDFYYGAMFISYAFSVGLVVTILIVLSVVYPGADMWVIGITVILTNALLIPVFLRYSKILYQYGVGKLKYDPKYSRS